jgi:hypothetical protein
MEYIEMGTTVSISVTTSTGVINIYCSPTIPPDFLRLLAEAAAMPAAAEVQERTPHGAGAPDAATGEG